MDPTAAESSPPAVEGPDLTRLERIEGELHAVERALEQIDQGVYDGFAGLEVASRESGPGLDASPAVEPPEPREV